jgi:hypothetical protein
LSYPGPRHAASTVAALVKGSSAAPASTCA